MSYASITPEEYFATIVEEFLSNPDVTPPSDGTQSKRGFGSSGLKIHNGGYAKTPYMAEFWLVFSQVLWKHFRS